MTQRNILNQEPEQQGLVLSAPVPQPPPPPDFEKELPPPDKKKPPEQTTNKPIQERGRPIETQLSQDVASIGERITTVDEKVDSVEEYLNATSDNATKVDWSYPNYGDWLSAGGGGGSFSGIAYIYGRKYTGLTDASLPFVKVNLATGQPSESAGPAPDPMPPNEEWFVKSEESGPIRIVNQ